MESGGLKAVDVYTPLGEIRASLEVRRHDQVLKKKVIDFFGDDYPYFLDHPDAQYAFFSRPVMTPNKELSYFFEMAEVFGMPYRLLEYPGRFVSKSREKRYAAKLCAHSATGKNGGHNRVSSTIIDFSKAEGKPFSEVETLAGDPLIERHHKLLRMKYPGIDASLIDITDWFEKVREKYSHYYLAFLALSIRNGAHFENYLEADPDEYTFFVEKVAPSFIEAERIFGVRPLIYPLLPLDNEKNPHWLHYTEEDLALLSGDTHDHTAKKRG